MVFKEFPNPQENSGYFYRDLWKKNVVLNAKSTSIQFHKKRGPLSIKLVRTGKEIYVINDTPITVTPLSYLTINANHTYSSFIDSEKSVDSLSIFFKENLENKVLSELIYDAEFLLDNPDYHPTKIEFFECNQAVNKKIKYLIEKLIVSDKNTCSNLETSEISLMILEELIHSHYQLYLQTESLQFIRKRTRIEIFKRILLARDYLDTCFCEEIQLQDLSRIASMSEFHFIRSFKSVVGVTPHKYLIGVRMHRALKLLIQRRSSISDVALRVGYLDVKSFRKTFKSFFRFLPSKIPEGFNWNKFKHHTKVN